MLKGIFLTLINNREFVWEMGLHELKTIHKRSFLGYMWLIIRPLVQAAGLWILRSLGGNRHHWQHHPRCWTATDFARIHTGNIVP